MKNFLIGLLVLLVSLTSVTANIFDIPSTGAWVKVQDGKVTQWSVIPAEHPKTRIDLISYVEDGKRMTYYLIRSANSDGKISIAVIKPGNKLGVGLDSRGNMVKKTATVLDDVNALPAEALALLKS